jgi:phosphoglycerate dehydrogenase-like enzyme
LKKIDKIAVCSRSFSQNGSLRSALTEKYEHVKFNDDGVSLSGDSLVHFLEGYDGAIIALESLDRYVLSQLHDLKFVGKYGVGLDKLDLDAMAKYGVMLGWTPGVNAQNVAEYTVAMCLNMLKQIPKSMQVASEGHWHQVKGYQLSTMTYGILGCGHVGRALVRLLKGFGCKILICDIKDFSDYCNDNDLEQVSLGELAERSDVLSIHIPKNDTTTEILDESLLMKMKRGSYVLNSARGGLIDESGILRLLESGHLAGAAFDVLAEEPPLDTRVIDHEKTLVTTHIAGSSHEAILAMGLAAISGLTDHRIATSFKEYQ